MEKEFIPYEQALTLKELGFDEPCASCYGSYVHKTSELFLNINNPVNIETLVREPTAFNQPSFYVKSPTFSQAFRWFREKYEFEFHIGCYRHTSVKYYQVYLDDVLGKHSYSFGKSFTYEEAELECLKKLIEIVKEK